LKNKKRAPNTTGKGLRREERNAIIGGMKGRRPMKGPKARKRSTKNQKNPRKGRKNYRLNLIIPSEKK